MIIKKTFRITAELGLGGLWHGAAWSYAVWGTWHGVALALERPCRRFSRHFAESRIWNLFTMGFVFLFVTLSWLLFQLPEFGEAVRYLQAIGQNTAIHIRVDRVLVILLYSLPVILYHLHGWSREHRKNPPSVSSIDTATNSGITVSGSTSPNFSVSAFQRFNISAFLYNLAYGGMLFWILFNSGSSEAFIYFQF